MALPSASAGEASQMFMGPKMSALDIVVK
ncbi:hypothetical protein MDG893_14198 [Marinobacter algicola DG893]|uniref:Uncharacterized protein n=1 Tax=Marinobacter algicola DG893 TaxID=443152 RepID=A6EZP9_9GAMM|nr:hypothetical protein MDG893_14198 [Marinobacter algicola DG893]